MRIAICGFLDIFALDQRANFSSTGSVAA